MPKCPRESTSDCIGNASEQIVLELARSLHLTGVYPLDRDCPEPYLTMRNSADDWEGIDLWVPTIRGDVGIQIKSSYEEASDFQKNHRNGHVIPAVRTRHRNIEAIRSELLSAIIWAMETWFPESPE